MHALPFPPGVGDLEVVEDGEEHVSA